MLDEEKVKKGLEMCSRDKWTCPKCPYFIQKGEPKCMSALGQDALKLIKKQQDIIDTHKANLEETLECLVEKTNVVRCKDCKHRFNGEHHDNCCDVLMGKVKWTFEVTVEPDWFCADGERRTE